MKKIENLNELLIEQGRELYSAERQQLEMLGKLKNQASSPRLKKIITESEKLTKDKQERLKKAFDKLKSNPEGEFSEPFGALINKNNQLINRAKNEGVRDASIINGIQKLGHYQIVGYGTLTAYAKEIGNKEVAELLHENLEADKTIDQKLSDLAKKEVNKKAIKPVMAHAR